MTSKFVFGTASKSRQVLIKQAGFVPDLVVSADIDETPKKKEKPIDYVNRVAKEKAEFLHQKHFGDIIFTADTIMSYQRQIIRKCNTDEEIKQNLLKFSNRSIKALTSICLITDKHKIVQKLIETSIKFKHLSEQDRDDYIKTKLGLGKAGGVCIEGFMESFVIKIVGSYSNIMGLPLYETSNILISAGVKRKIDV